MTRTEAILLMESHIVNKNLRKHILAVEAVMKALAQYLNQDPTPWALAGLLHDLDYEETKNQPDQHGLVTAEWLKNKDLPQEIIDAIKAHAGKKPRETLMEKAIYCADPVTGFLVACALIHPDKKLASIDATFALNRFKEKRFAAGANREIMQSCSELGLTLEQFFELALEAMKSISKELEL